MGFDAWRHRPATVDENVLLQGPDAPRGDRPTDWRRQLVVAQGAAVVMHLPAGVSSSLLSRVFLAGTVVVVWLTRVTNERLGDDFRYGVWGPTRAALHGINPYDASPAYTALTGLRGSAPLYVPFTYLVHAPVAALGSADAGFAATLIGATLIWAAVLLALPPTSGRRCVVAAVIGTAVFLTSQAQASLYLGQQAPWMLFGLALAVHGVRRDRPWVAALGVALAAMKPQTAVPLAIAVVLLGHWRIALRAVVIAGIGSLPGVIAAMIGAGGPVALVGSFSSDLTEANALSWNDLTNPSNNRIDLLGIVSHLGGPGLNGLLWSLVTLAACTVVAGVVLRRSARTLGPTALADPRVLFVVVTYVLLSLYHQPYDVLIVFLPLLLAAHAIRVDRAVIAGSVALLAIGVAFRVSLIDRYATILDASLHDVRAASFTIPSIALLAVTVVVGRSLLIRRSAVAVAPATAHGASGAGDSDMVRSLPERNPPS